MNQPYDEWLRVDILSTPLDPAAAIAEVTLSAAGGITLFLGTTREERHSDHGELLYLEYEAHPTMAIGEIHKIAGEAKQCWPILKTVILHRTGIVAVGEASVVIAVSCAHRDSAYEASRYLIDELKKRVPIWKKEHYAAHTRWQKDA